MQSRVQLFILMFQSSNQYNNSNYNDQPKKHGSSLKPYKVERIREEGTYGFCSLKNILGMLEYKGTSIEEIRNEDYELGRKPQVSFYHVNYNNAPPLQNQQNSIMNNYNNQNTQPQNFMQKPNNPWDTTNKANDPFKPINNYTMNTSFQPTSQPNFGNAPQPNAQPINTFGQSNTQQTANPNPWAPPVTENKSTHWAPPLAAQPYAFPQSNFNIPLAPTSYQAQNQAVPENNPNQFQFPKPASSFMAEAPKKDNPFMQQSFAQPSQNYVPPSQSFEPSSQGFMPPGQSYVPISQNNVPPNQGFAQPNTFNYSQQTSFQDTTNIDPFSASQIKFETSSAQDIPLKKLLTKDIFEDEKEEKELKLEVNKENKLEREKRLLENKLRIYTIPSLDEIKNMNTVKNLRVCFGNKAFIDYLEDINSSDVILEQNLELARPIIYMTAKKGKGLNKRARVTINEFWPIFRGKMLKTPEPDYPEKGVIDRFIYELENNEQLEFVSYDFETGCYVYEVENFEFC